MTRRVVDDRALERARRPRNDKRNIEYEELPRNPLNNKLMCLWHGEGTHDTGMCAYLKKDKKLLKRLEDGEPSTYPRFKAPTSNRQHGNTREQPHPAAGRAQLPHDAARDRIANYQVTHRAKALRTSSLEMPTHCIKIPKSRFNDMSTKEDPAVLLDEYDRLLDRMTAAGVKSKCLCEL